MGFGSVAACRHDADADTMHAIQAKPFPFDSLLTSRRWWESHAGWRGHAGWRRHARGGSHGTTPLVVVGRAATDALLQLCHGHHLATSAAAATTARRATSTRVVSWRRAAVVVVHHLLLVVGVLPARRWGWRRATATRATLLRPWVWPARCCCRLLELRKRELAADNRRVARGRSWLLLRWRRRGLPLLHGAAGHIKETRARRAVAAVPIHHVLLHAGAAACAWRTPTALLLWAWCSPLIVAVTAQEGHIVLLLALYVCVINQPQAAQHAA